ncbi:MAG TPA: hypothetical protein VJC15_03030 [Candidatus Paceibacterota bacterium]
MKVVVVLILVGALSVLGFVAYCKGISERGLKTAPSATAIAAAPTFIPQPTIWPRAPTSTPPPAGGPAPTVTPTPTRPAPTPTPIPAQIATPIPAAPALQTSTYEAVKKNEIVLLYGGLPEKEEIMPGATPNQFHLRLGGCGCMRSLMVEVKKLNPSQGSDLQKGIRLESAKGQIAREGQEFFVPYTGTSAFVFIWADPGTKLGGFERITVWMKEEGIVVDSVILAENLEVPESLPILSQVYQSFGDRATGFVRIRNKSPWSQTIHNLQVSGCNFPKIGTPRFSQDGDIVIQPGETIDLNIDITILGMQSEGVVFCACTFERKKEALTLDHR